MKMQRWEKAIEYITIGVILFIGVVSLLYSWIDSAFNINIGNIYLLAALAAVISFIIVYLIRMFDNR